MAGNTKLIGFGVSDSTDPGGGGITLERWGKKINVMVSTESINKLRDACYTQLPQVPIQHGLGHLDDFALQYDEPTGRITAIITPEEAGRIITVLETIEGCSSKRIRFWIDSLKGKVRAHKDYLSMEGEPGIE